MKTTAERPSLMIDPTQVTDAELLLNAQNRARVVMARMLQPVIENPLDPGPMEAAARVQRLLSDGLSQVSSQAVPA